MPAKDSAKPKPHGLPVKLSHKRQSVISTPCGLRIVFRGVPSDGKPAVLVVLPEGVKIEHENLTPPPDVG